MTEVRTDRILAELAQRYALTEAFQRQLRPAVATILSDEISEDDRVSFLEELAENCQRDQKIRSSTGAPGGSLQSIADSLRDLVVRLMQARGAKQR